MKRILMTVVGLLMVTPAFAQDVDLGLGGDVSSLLNLPAPRGAAPARGGDSRGRAATPAVDRLIRLRELLASANAPLTKEQEASLNGVLNAEIPAMRRTLQARVAELQKTPGTQPTMDDLTPEIIRLNDQLLGKMATAPGLAPEQQALLKQLYKNQVKARGGFDAIKLALEDAGEPFSAEQITQIQPLFDGQTDKQQILAKVLKLLTPTQRTALLAK